jgi:HEPN domain-containing protein
MASREQDWLDQAKRDLEHARHSLRDADFEWACFAAQQASEKAVKAVYQRREAEAWGHAVSELLEGLQEPELIAESVVDMARELDRHYIPARYPNAHPQGAPFRYYTRGDAERAIGYGESIIRVCEDLLAQ